MGILAVLDQHAAASPARPQYAQQVEYHLVSWGEICAPFMGDREHSPYGRVVLDKPPFKLVSISEPYSRPPQKLCLTFTAPMETRPQANLSGVFPHEAAQEFAAFLSVLTRRRVFAYRVSRSNGWPVEEQFDFYEQSHSQELQRPTELEPSRVYDLLERVRTMDRSVADRFILALRFYHAAVRTMFTQPEFSYLFLVSCLEAISSVVNEKYVPDDTEAYLDCRFGGWKALRTALPSDRQAELPKLLLANDRFIFSKIAKFVEDHLPECFWLEPEDDAKPDYWTTMVGSGPDGRGQETVIRSNAEIRSWEKIERAQLRQRLRSVYEARSRLVHRGVRFPPGIVLGHFSRIPAAAYAAGMQEAVSRMSTPTIPPLLTFERLVSHTLVNYLHNSPPAPLTPNGS